MKKDWTYKKLGEVAEIKAGFTPSSSELHEAGEYPYYKVSDMNTTGNEVFLISTLSYVKQSKKYFPKGSIAFPKNGAAIATNKKRILKYDSIVDLNTGVCIFDSDILPKFGYYWFQNIDFRNYTRGGALPTLDIKTISLKAIPIPPISIQESIVRELDAIHGILEKKQEQLRELDNLAQAIFHEMFGDPITNPKQWEVKKLGEVCEALTGITYKPADVADDGIIVLRSGNIQEGEIDLQDLVRIKKKIADKYFVQPGDILMCSRNGSFRLVGKAAKIPVLEETMTWGAFMTVIRSNYNPYILSFLRTPAFREQLTNAKTTTVNQITISMINNISLPLPPLSLQQSFAAKIEAIEAQKTAIRQSIREVEALLVERMDNYFS